MNWTASQSPLPSLIGLVFFSLTSLASASNTLSRCSVPDNLINIKKADNVPEGATIIEADKALLNKKGISNLKGSVIIHHNGRTINAQNLDFDNRDSMATAFGKVLLSTPEIDIKGRDINYKLNTDQGELKDAVYYLKDGSGNGSSTKLTRKGKNLSTLSGATFSTCPADARSWHLQANRIDLHHDTKIGAARHVVLRVGKLPVFYTPYVNFPLDGQRKSGFLTPSYQISDRSGSILSIPYYLNLAPNYDATLNAKILTKRGSMLETGFRYLTPLHRGQLNLSYLPSDNVADDANRYLASIDHTSKLPNNTQLTIKATTVSDDHYFSDLGNSLMSTSTAYLERKIDLTHTKKNWRFSSSIQNYEILDNNSVPYSKLPELKLSYLPQLRNNKRKFSLQAELVNFDKTNAASGLRFDIHSQISQHFGTSGWYIKPSIQLRHTQYALKNTTDNNLNRTLPTVSIDSGLFFERNINNGKTQQTLEPRIHYTYTPFKDQSQFPVFDSASLSSSTLNQLFSNNRFSGKDRIGDTNKLTLGLTTRFIKTSNGRERLKLSLGQAFYFTDRRVSIAGDTIGTTKRTDIALELSGQVTPKVRLINNSYWDPNIGQLSSTETRLHYADKKQRKLNLSYRYLDDSVKQATASFSIPVGNQWKVLGSTDYDLKKDRVLETLAGVEYSNCCVKTRFVARRFLTSDNITYDTTPFIEFELKGIGSIGNQGRNLLEEKIYGYKND